jgi:hypothetical protein
MCKSFFATLECELLARCGFKTQAKARNATFAFIERSYDKRRRHSSIGYRSPIDYECRHQNLKVDPAAIRRGHVKHALCPIETLDQQAVLSVNGTLNLTNLGAGSATCI